MATELIKGKTIKEALELTNKAVVEALDELPPAKLTARCSPKKQLKCYSRLLSQTRPRID